MLIIDMPMPKCCADCPMIALSDRGMICLCTEALLEIDYDKKRPSWCPIKGELVRCKECRWACLAPQRQTATCMKKRLPFTHDYDFFCADGERKDGEHDPIRPN